MRRMGQSRNETDTVLLRFVNDHNSSRQTFLCEIRWIRRVTGYSQDDRWSRSKTRSGATRSLVVTLSSYCTGSFCGLEPDWLTLQKVMSHIWKTENRNISVGSFGILFLSFVRFIRQLANGARRTADVWRRPETPGQISVLAVLACRLDLSLYQQAVTCNPFT